MRARTRGIFLLVSAALAAGCAGPAKRTSDRPPTERPTPARSGAFYGSDGPPERLPADLDRIPDAVPREEPLHRFANRPYNVFGVDYTPMTRLVPMSQRGMASWYGRKFHGQRTAIGEIYDMFAMTAAHPTLPLPSYARVTHLRSGRSVVVRVNDRGPFLHGRIIDLSYAAAHRLGIAQTGSGEVLVELLVPPFDAAPPLASASAPTPAAAPSEAPRFATPPTPAPGGEAPPTAPSPREARFFVQLGAFGNFANASAFQARVQATLDGRAVEVRQREGLFRVQLGPFASRAEAERAQREAEAALGTSLILVEVRP